MTTGATEHSLEKIWSAPLRQAARGKASAAAFLNETISDAASAGVTPTQIARQLGISSRLGIYSAVALEHRDSSRTVDQPVLAPVVWLRGAKADEATWEAVRTAMWRRGWHTTVRREEVWHLARAHALVVMVDFSVRKRADVKIGHVEARTGTPAAAGRPAPMQLPVTLVDSLPLGRTEDGQIDADAIAVTVGQAIGLARLEQGRS